MLSSKYRSHFLLSAITVAISLFIWLTFYFNLPPKIGLPATTLETVFANYDGPNYMVIAKCGYVKECIGRNFSLPQPLEYYPAHLPGFPLLIHLFSFFTTTPKGMILSVLVGSVLLTLSSFEFFKLFVKSKTAFYLSIFMIFFPARLFSLRFVGAPEVWYISTILLSIIFYKKDRFLLSSLFGSFALLLKSPAILLFAAYGLMFLQKRRWQYLWYSLIPLTALGVFILYYFQTGDFWAYFNSGDNRHLNLLPYLVFVSNRTWIDTIWLEDVIYIYTIAIYGLFRLFKKYKYDIIFVFPLIYSLAAIFVAHRDISRYIAPAYPFFILIFHRFLASKKFKYVFWLIVPAVIIYTINFIIGNTAPVADWTPYL